MSLPVTHRQCQVWVLSPLPKCISWSFLSFPGPPFLLAKSKTTECTIAKTSPYKNIRNYTLLPPFPGPYCTFTAPELQTDISPNRICSSGFSNLKSIPTCRSNRYLQHSPLLHFQEMELKIIGHVVLYLTTKIKYPEF